MKTLRSCIRGIAILIFASLAIVPARGQDVNQQYFDRLNIVKGNKIALIGDWKQEDIAKWRKVLSAADILEHDFQLVGRGADILPNRGRTTFEGNFETWLKKLVGSNRARWAALDASNKVITSGADIPDSATLGKECDRFGLVSPQKRLRSFLKEHPGHIEAQADLLKEVRRRALLAMPKEITEDLGDMDDLRTWALLAAELNKAMAMDWVGFNLDFFRPEEDQPERFSPIMKAAFRRHIARIENNLRDFPTNENLWEMWAWMARSLGRPTMFWKSLNPFVSTEGPNCPSAKVAAWLTEEARSMGDWESVITLAKIGRYFTSYMNVTLNAWMPGSLLMGGFSEPIVGFPEKSSYIPQLDALLKLGRFEEANALYDEIIRTGFPYAEHLAAVARANKVEEVALLWEKGQVITPRPYYGAFEYLKGNVRFAILAKQGDKEYMQMQQLIDELLPGAYLMEIWQVEDAKTLGWVGEGFHWAVLGGDSITIAQGEKMPTRDELKQILRQNGLKSRRELAEDFLKDNPGNIEATIALGVSLLEDGARSAKNSGNGDNELPAELDDAIWGQAAYVWPTIFSRSHALYNLPYIYIITEPRSPTMKMLSRRYMPMLEEAISQSPFSDNLWSHWLFWRRAGGSERDFETLFQSLLPSPIVPEGMFPPPSIIEEYYNECKKNEQWDKLATLLKGPYERTISSHAIDNIDNEKRGEEPRPINPGFGDSVVLPLIEALLRSGERTEADEVFNALLAAGGSFSNPSNLVELARGLAGEKIAKDWEAKMGKK